MDAVFDRGTLRRSDESLAARLEYLSFRAPLAASLRTLDAIHLPAATTAGPQLEARVTYDDRMVTVARDAGLPCGWVVVRLFDSDSCQAQFG